MDPISAFSLACNIIQVVDFGFKLAAGCRQIYASGSLESNDHIELVATDLRRISEEIEKAAAKNAGDRELTDLASRSAATSKKLLSVLEDIKMKNQKSKRNALGKTVTAMWKKGALDDLQKQLVSYQKALETRMLKRLCDKFDLASLQQKHAFASLDQSMQNMIQGLIDGRTKLTELISKEAGDTRLFITKEMEDTRTSVTQEGITTRMKIADEAKASRMNIGDEFFLLKIAQADEAHRKAVMESLFFPDIHSRQETIKEAHRNTFQWIFETNSQQTQSWSNFAEWLQNGQGIYWISGKAGSGKSTLMNYVFAEERTTEALKTWAGKRQLLTPTFFFWNAGSTLQKSTGGLLRSLLYQLLEQRPSLGSLATQSPIPTWTDARLLKTLLELIRQNLCDDAICFFIDGLDEFQGDQRDLIDLISGIEKPTNVKICVSSRPLRAFQISFGSAPRLKLEDLTREDIAKLVNDKLGSTAAAKLAETLTYRADGVFLWVALALKDVLRGVENGDSFVELQHRLKILPQEIGNLYLHMLERLDTIYQDWARTFLRFMILRTLITGVEQMTLLDFAPAAYDRTDAVIASGLHESDIEHLVSECRKLRTQMVIRCAGLLELEAPQFDESIRPAHETAAHAELLHFHENSRINFIHVSAFDFLLNDEKGIGFMDSNRSLDACAVTQLLKARLVQARLLTHSSRLKEDNGQLLDLVRLVRKISELSESIDVLLDTMDRLFTEIHGSCNQTISRDTQLQQHWFTEDDSLSEVPVPTSVAYAEGPRGNTKPTFLGFAAWHGLYEYVCKKLDQLPQVEATETASHMLIFTLVAPRCNILEKADGVKQLFRYGADGGMVFNLLLEPDTIHGVSKEKNRTVTGWKFFLDMLAYQSVKIQSVEASLKPLSLMADEFLSQPIDPGISAEILLFINYSEHRSLFCRSMSEWLARPEGYFAQHPALVVSMSPALVLNYLPDSYANKLPLGMRTDRSLRVRQVLSIKPRKLYDLSETQSDYLTKAFEAWLAACVSDPDLKLVKSKVIESTLCERLCEVLGECGVAAFRESSVEEEDSVDEESSIDEETKKTQSTEEAHLRR
jgi:hypothetical protein